MAIYHFSAKIFSNSKDASAIAKACYRSGDKLHDDLLNRTFDYSHRDGVLYSQVLIPEHCPEEYRNREKIWNAVSEQKNRVNSRFAREFEIALPNEWSVEFASEKTCEFVQKEFVDKGMICDVNIHQSKSENNLHAHVMATVDPVDEHGQFHCAEKKVFAKSVEINIEEAKDRADELEKAGITYEIIDENTISVSAESINNGTLKNVIDFSMNDIKASYNENFPSFDKNDKETEKYRLAELNKDGSLKQRRVVKNGKEYFTQKYMQVRTDRNEWDSKEMLLEWRKDWAEHCNKYLAPEQHIDHRSLKDQGIDREPTIHEGVAAREMEKRGEISELCEYNREIIKANSLMDTIKEGIAQAVSAISFKLEEVFKNIELFNRTDRPERDKGEPEQTEEHDLSTEQVIDRPYSYADRDSGRTGQDDSRIAGILARATGVIDDGLDKNEEVKHGREHNEGYERELTGPDSGTAGRTPDNDGTSSGQSREPEKDDRRPQRGTEFDQAASRTERARIDREERQADRALRKRHLLEKEREAEERTLGIRPRGH